MVWAWAQEISATEVLVLIALADHADDDGLCWPGQKGLAQKTKLTRQAINGILKRLKEAGIIEVIPRWDSLHRPLANYYQLCMKQGGNVNQDDIGYVNQDDHTVNQDDTNLHSESSKRESSKKRKVRLPPDFALSSQLIEYFRKHFPTATDADIDQQFEKFKYHHESKQSYFVNWVAAWRYWTLNAVQFGLKLHAGVAAMPSGSVIADRKREEIDRDAMTPEQRQANLDQLRQLTSKIGKEIH